MKMTLDLCPKVNETVYFVDDREIAYQTEGSSKCTGPKESTCLGFSGKNKEVSIAEKG